MWDLRCQGGHTALEGSLGNSLEEMASALLKEGEQEASKGRNGASQEEKRRAPGRGGLNHAEPC